ncbi:class I SAM-dependent methyltransferase [Shouchella lonarensis]|uniref:Methyltransferase domain-containing protein n=1 Tax=Shouchella lonarensis TaxID=1464122 RepID=A0A1G6KSE4_9BACI|nr:methyltransferase domain-containing protein [Shouchella lonarensis]SDC34022.1 Methyltransferase domain-containing protein [Shouchella lonarensis]
MSDETIIHRGYQSETFYFEKSGQSFIRKVFLQSNVGKDCFNQEKLAQKTFKQFDWMLPWEEEDNSMFVTKMFPSEHRLDLIAPQLSKEQQQDATEQIMSIILDLYVHGFAHCDLHAKNLFYHNSRVTLIDYETLRKYPNGHPPPFFESYDLTGKGLKSPYETGNMFFFKEHPVSICNILHVATLDEATEALKTKIISELTSASTSFRKKQGRLVPKKTMPYATFSLPTIEVKTAHRNSTRRLQQFEMNESDLRNKTLLDLGSHCGSMIFESQKLKPKMCLGIEYDEDKVHVAKKIAAFAGLNHVQFKQGDLEKLSLKDLNHSFDVVYCLSIDAHVQNKEHLYRLLESVTKELLLFEMNTLTPPKETIKDFQRLGFNTVSFLGYCDDERGNTTRALFKAWK